MLRFHKDIYVTALASGVTAKVILEVNKLQESGAARAPAAAAAEVKAKVGEEAAAYGAFLAVQALARAVEDQAAGNRYWQVRVEGEERAEDAFLKTNTGVHGVASPVAANIMKAVREATSAVRAEAGLLKIVMNDKEAGGVKDWQNVEAFEAINPQAVFGMSGAWSMLFEGKNAGPY
jgi:deoxyribose-phosphate aldolase